MALATYDAKLAKIQEDKKIEKFRGPTEVTKYDGPKIKFEDTGLYKSLVKAGEIEDELTKIRNLIRKRTDPSYEPDDDNDFKAQPVRKFDAKMDYYTLLDVDDFASVKEIKAAYKKMALKCHPDKNRSKNAHETKKIQDEFEKIQEAYEILCDRATRRQYDRAKFDEQRAKSQGMGSFFGKPADKDKNFWGRWSAKKKDTNKAAASALGEAAKGPKLPKAKDLRVAVRISLDKALRGGLKIIEVTRDRMQRAVGGSSKSAQTFHVPIGPGQLDGSEHRLEQDGHWASLAELPGDLVFEFKHKRHPYLRQTLASAESRTAGDLELAAPLAVRCKAADRVLMACSRTFKGQMVLVRFLNPLIACSPSRSASVSFRLEREGLPVMGEARQRGALTITVNVELEDGQSLAPSLGVSCCQQALLRRHLRACKQHPMLRADVRNSSVSMQAAAVRRYSVEEAFAEDGERVVMPALLMFWEGPPGTDVVAFAKACGSLASQAWRNPASYVWGYHPLLPHPALLAPGHVTLGDEEIASDGEDEEIAEAEKRKRGRRVERLKRRVVPEVEKFLTKFSLGPPEGFADPSTSDEEAELRAASQPKKPHASSSRPPVTKGVSKPGEAAVELVAGELEDEEEKDLTQFIREKADDVEQTKRKWYWKKEKRTSQREDEEGLLRELLEKDKQREVERIDNELGRLRPTFESQVAAEDRWLTEFQQTTPWKMEWAVVFKPAMVARANPKETGAVTRRMLFEEIVKSKVRKPTEDYWVELDKGDWALTWHEKHGRLLQKWFGPEQDKFLELEKKIADRRQNRNKTFVEAKRRKKEVGQWTIPPKPTDEEQYEIADEEQEDLSNQLAPLLVELKDAKRRLRELRQRRLDTMASRARRDAGDIMDRGKLPAGFFLEDRGERAAPLPAAREAPAPVSSTQLSLPLWETTKKSADAAFGRKDWNTALGLYTQAIEAGSTMLTPRQSATLLSNRALVHGKLDDWPRSLEDAVLATEHDGEWSKGWLRRITAEVRLARYREAMSSLKRGLLCPESVAVQLLPLVTEAEAALYDSGVSSAEAPATATERIAKFRESGTEAFGKCQWGLATFWYTRGLYHRSMMESVEESCFLSNRSAAFLKLGYGREALADALASAPKFPTWAKPLVRAGQAALLLQDFKGAYRHFAQARVVEPAAPAAADGLNDCFQRILKWDYPAATKRWARFSEDRRRPADRLRVWALSDLHFDQHGVPEWCKSLSSSFFRDDVLMLAGNIAGSLSHLRFGLTVLKSKFRRIFFVPGNQDLWVRKWTIADAMRGDKVQDEHKMFGDSLAKLLEVLQVCDDLGVETTPAEVGEGVFVVPFLSWYSRDFISREQRKKSASTADVDQKTTIDQWIKWPFPAGSDDAWRFLMRMNEPSLRGTVIAKSAYERFSGKRAKVLTMTHFLTRTDLPFDWTVPGVWDYMGCSGLDEQVRMLNADVHVYGHSCTGKSTHTHEGVVYVNNYIGMPDQHREGMSPLCILNGSALMPKEQPVQDKGFNFKPVEKPQPRQRQFGGG